MKDAQRCLDWLKTKYDISSLSARSLIEIVLEWGREDALKNAANVLEWKKEQDEKQKKEEENRIDFKEESDSDGRIWVVETHNFHQREESRRLKRGDIIKFESSENNGMMIIDSFDYGSDFAARSYYHIYTHKYYNKDGKEHIAIFNGSSSAPWFRKFSKATDEEIANFFKQIEDCYPEDLYFFFRNEWKYMPEEVKERYSKYYKE